jgi:hypothetical protein
MSIDGFYRDLDGFPAIGASVSIEPTETHPSPTSSIVVMLLGTATAVRYYRT